MIFCKIAIQSKEAAAVATWTKQSEGITNDGKYDQAPYDAN